MKMLQVPTCIAVIAAPYWILYTKTALKYNFNNRGLAVRAIGYYLLASCVKVLILATGVPEVIGRYLLGEKVVLAILNCSIYIGLVIALRGKENANTNIANIVVATGLGWSMPESLGRLILETIRCIKQSDHSERFVYAAIDTNLSVLSSVLFTAIFFMWLRDKNRRYIYTGLIVIAMLLFPVLSLFNEIKDADVSRQNVLFLAHQGLLTLIFAAVVLREFRKLETADKSS